MEIKVKLDNFEGPLDLLIHLIENRKMDPTQLIISKLIDDYLIFLEEMQKENLEIRIEFLVMASDLLEIKALSILNISEKEKKEEELGQKIKEYKLFKELSQEIEKLENEYNVPYSKGGINIVKRASKEVDLSKLKIEDIFQSYISQFKESEETLEINIKQAYSLSDEIEKLDKNLKKYRKIDADAIFEDAENRLHLVYIFLAILEMYRNNLIEIDEKIIWLRKDF